MNVPHGFIYVGSFLGGEHLSYDAERASCEGGWEEESQVSSRKVDVGIQVRGGGRMSPALIEIR